MKATRITSWQIITASIWLFACITATVFLVNTITEQLNMPVYTQSALIVTSLIMLVVLIVWRNSESYKGEIAKERDNALEAVKTAQENEKLAFMALKDLKAEVSTLKQAEGEAEKLRNALTADRKELSNARQVLSSVRLELNTCKEELNTCKADLQQVLECASKEATRVKELTNACEELREQADARVKEVSERCKKTIAHERTRVAELSKQVKELSPYLTFFESYKAYKDAQSTLNSLKKDKALSEQEREEAKQKASKAFYEAKEQMNNFITQNTNT